MSGAKYCHGCHEKLPCECRTDFYDSNGKVINNHENKLRKIIAEKNAEIELLRNRSLTEAQAEMKLSYDAEINLLKEELRKERLAVDFYADSENWDECQMTNDGDLDGWKMPSMDEYEVQAGKLARETVKNRSVRL